MATLCWPPALDLHQIRGGVGFVVMAASLGMAGVVDAAVVGLAAAGTGRLSVDFASILYTFVMPQLSSFAGLGGMIFAVTFAICYLFAAPRQTLGRRRPGHVVTIAGRTNGRSQQAPCRVAKTAPHASADSAPLRHHARHTGRRPPEQAYDASARFSRSCEHPLLHPALAPDPLLNALARCRRQPSTPARSRPCSHRSAARRFPSTPRRGLGRSPGTGDHAPACRRRPNRMQELLEARQSPEVDRAGAREPLADARAWRLAIEGLFEGLARGPDVGSAADPVAARRRSRERLTKKLEHLEQRIEETLNQAADGG